MKQKTWKLTVWKQALIYTIFFQGHKFIHARSDEKRIQYFKDEGPPLEGIESVDFGNDYEKEARNRFIQVRPNFECLQVGLVIKVELVKE